MPSLIPGYEYDIFISYRQKDNKYDGWVTEFVSNLKKELEATFKDDVSIYFDENPHDGLLETHNVNRSLELKLKSLIIIPIVSQTYCDPKSFAWQNEFVAFNRQIASDPYGKNIKLTSGNIASRILPVRIHDLDPEDIALFEKETGEVMRSVDFIYRLPGVNRQLRAKDDEQIKAPNQILYRDQINKLARAIKEIITGIKNFQGTSTQSIAEPVPQKPESPSEIPNKEKAKRDNKPLPVKMWGLAVIVTIAIVGYYLVPRWLNERRARTELLPAIQKLVDENFVAPTQAFEMANEATQYIHDDSTLIRLWPKVSRTIDFFTKPEGAEVYWRNYDNPSDHWKILGTTPLDNIRIPLVALFKIEKPGFPTTLVTSGRIRLETEIQLDSIGTVPDNMVRVPSRRTGMYIVGLEHHGGKEVGEFLVDRFEVTNNDYKRFVDAGGYKNKVWWPSPIYDDGKEISWEQAMALFVDKTGRAGPAGWEAGTYPNGKENHPVDGVSWYEASAFAAFSGKQLPTVFHWSVIAETNRAANIIPLSNFGGVSSTTVGSHQGISTFGIYDLAGNVREWCSNGGEVKGTHYILGGGWNDPTYSFNDAFSANGLDRSITNGFRCIQTLPEDSSLALLTPSLGFAFRDYKKEKPVDDATFKIFLSQYAYDKTPLEAQVDPVTDTSIWKIEKATINAGYGDERLVVYVFLPKGANAPYQPILFFPGSNVIYEDQLAPDNVRRLDFILKSGRALILPIFKGTFERRDELNSDLANETVFYRDHVIMWRKDLGRAIDYLETREDMVADKIGYFGWSWGGFMGGILPAIEPRIKAVVLHVGGMEMNKSLPEVDQINFLPRVLQPVLMLNGKHDMFFPVETSQKPMFNLLGTPTKDKRIISYDAGHLVPRQDLIRETLVWFDKYLAPVTGSQ